MWVANGAAWNSCMPYNAYLPGSAPATSSIFRVSAVRFPQLYLGLGITTLANLVLELSLTRIFSVVFYNHFAFLAISVALFGLGAGGVLSYAVSSRRGPVFEKLGTLAVANSVCVVASLWFVLSRPAGPMRVVTLAEVYLVSALPFVFAGAIVSLAIAEAIQHIDRAYFFDLAGAATGCLLLVPLLNLLGGPNALLSVGIFYAISAVIWFNLAGSPNRRTGAIFVALLLMILLAANFKHPMLDLRVAKGEQLPPERFVRWNSFSRIGVTHEGSNWNIVADGDAATAIPTYDWDNLTPHNRFTLLHRGPGFPYLLRPGAKTLIIGSGGGVDVARALASGSRDVSAIEINPIIADTIGRKEFVNVNHGLFLRPEVHLFTEDGRSFVRSTRERYQVLQASHVNSWASTAAGAFALSETNLYTSDAFYDYLTCLTDDGFLAFTRWGFDPPRDSLRLISLAVDALKKLGEHRPWLNIIVIREDAANAGEWNTDTVMISRKPFAAADLARLRVGLAESRLHELYVPGGSPDNAFGKLLLTPDRKAFYAQYPYNVSAVDDDHPFFFYTIQPRDLWNFVSRAKRVNPSAPLLFGLIVVSIAAAVLIALLPRLLLGSRRPQHARVITFLWYFLTIGAAYILIQIALIQKFMLLLGPPTYALTVIVFSMLVAGGAGSFFSQRIIAGDDKRLMGVLAGVMILLTVLALSATPLTAMAAGWPLWAKITLTCLSIGPAAFLMGIPFPSGLRRLEQWHHPSIRLAWSLNSAASVLGSGSAMFLAIYLGLFATLLIGGGLYLVALVIVLVTRKQQVAPVL
jgi:predicted membrane-bound spermidine synthase